MNEAPSSARRRTAVAAALIAAAGAIAFAPVAGGQNAVAEEGVAEGASGERQVDPIRRESTPDRSDSASGQFVVYGEDWRLRGEFCLLAEEVKNDFLRLMRTQDAWKYQIILQIRQSPGGLNSGPPVRSKISPVENTFRFLVRVEIGDKLEREAIRDEVLDVLIYEFILRNRNLVGDTRAALKVPDWLRRGLGGAIVYREKEEGRKSLFSAIFRSGRILSIPDVMRGVRASATSVENAIYDASATALVLTLLGQADGPEKMRRLMADLLVFDGSDYAVIKKYYPDLSESSNSLEKWWALQIATLAEPSVLDLMTVAETETALQRALLLRMPVERESGERGGVKWRSLFNLSKGKEPLVGEASAGPIAVEMETYELEDYEEFIKRKDLETSVGSARLRLMSLEFRAFPVYRPIIAEYADILQGFAKGKRRGVDGRLAELRNVRLELLTVARDAEDYLHWYEATQEDRPSGAFEEYRRLIERLQDDRPTRQDPLSRYLDTMEKEWR